MGIFSKFGWIPIFFCIAVEYKHNNNLELKGFLSFALNAKKLVVCGKIILTWKPNQLSAVCS